MWEAKGMRFSITRTDGVESIERSKVVYLRPEVEKELKQYTKASSKFSKET